MYKIIKNEALCYDDVLIIPSKSDIQSRNDCNIDVSPNFYGFKLPFIPANMDTISGPKMVLKMQKIGGLGVLHRYASLQDKLDLLYHPDNDITKPIGLSFGISTKDLNDIKVIVDHNKNAPLYIFIDIAHAHSVNCLNFIELLNKEIPYEFRLSNQIYIVVGNIATPSAVKDFINLNVDILKVGIGPGSVCSTREKTGCGYPQLQALLDIKQEYQTMPIIADGGIKTPGDAAKALTIANFVMIGGMFAGTDCVPGWDEMAEKIKKQNESLKALKRWGSLYADFPRTNYLPFRGMASKEAKELASKDINYIEGASTDVLMREEGSTERIIKELSDGVKSAMSYVGARNLSEFREKANFVKVTSTTLIENKVRL